ncbi:MAG: YihY/virulence factor BrkB family protein [Candidatus Gastranaerophilales bacterium]|nr:YihY/virulence factor BrkB family protein [Candidatus Gastranaerophilales bacterium]
MKEPDNIVYKYIKRQIENVIEADFPGMAAEMAFMFVLGIFPFLLFLTSLFAWLGKKSLMAPILNFLVAFTPQDVSNLIINSLNEAMVFQQGGTIAIICFFVTLGLASNAIAVIMKGLNRVYGINECRPFWYTRLLSVLMVFANAFVLFISVNLIILGKVILEFLIAFTPIPNALINFILIARWPVSFLALYLVTFINYYILPAVIGHTKAKRKSVLPGTLFFCFFWLLGSWTFSLYLSNLNTYNRVYGTIGAFAILMVWLYYTSLIILIGGEINSQVYIKLEDKEKEN